MSACAIYTRYSSDLQKPTSTEDQIRLCKKAAREAGWSISRIYSDEEKSGTFMGNRPAFRRLLADARAGKFQFVVAEGLDRLSRDLGDIAYFYKAMKFGDIKIFSVANRSFVTEMHVSFEGLKNQQYSQDLAEKVRRGQRGATARGRVMGGTPYGYLRLKGVGVEPGSLVIDEEQKKIVQRIFTEYDAGKSALAVAKDLNRERVPSAKGTRWSPSAICGSSRYEIGVLRNRLYTGEISYGKAEYRHDPDTNVRKARVGTDIERKYVADFRIIDDELFERCQKRLAAMSRIPLNERVRPKRLLSKKVHCGVCGTTYVGVVDGKLRCRGRAFDGTCSNRRGIDRVVLETTILNLLKAKLLVPDLVRRYVAEYRGKYQAAIANHDDVWHATEKRARDLDKQVSRLLAKIRSGQAESAAEENIMRDFNRVSAELENVRLELADKPPPPPQPLATELVIERIGRQLDTLQSWIDGDTVDASYARDMFRCLVDRITLTPIGPDTNLTGSGALAIEITGKLADLLTSAGESPNCIIQSRHSPLPGLDNTDAVWLISAEIPGWEAPLGGTFDVLAVLQEAETSLPTNVLIARMVKRRGIASTRRLKRQLAPRVWGCLADYRRKGAIIDVSAPSERVCRWVLADRAAELAPAAPRVAPKKTNFMMFALNLLRKNKAGLKSSEIAKKYVQAQGMEPTKARWQYVWNRHKPSMFHFERAGAIKNIAPPHAAAKRWVLVEAPSAAQSSATEGSRPAHTEDGANPPRTATADHLRHDPYRKDKQRPTKKRKTVNKSKTHTRRPKRQPPKRPTPKSAVSRTRGR